MEIQLLETAKLELDEAYEYYEDQLPGLGAEFLSEILSAFSRMKLNPES